MVDAPIRSFTFTGIDSAPVPSLLRGFSAPVVLDDGLGDDELLILLAHDTDPFNRWESAQRLMLGRLLAAVKSGAEPVLDDALANALRGVLREPALDAALKDLILTLPTESIVAEQLGQVDPQRIHVVREQLREKLAAELHDDWAWAWDVHQVREGYDPGARQAGRRALAGLALQMLCLHAVRHGDTVWPGRAYQRVKDAGNMTDRLHALGALVDSHAALAEGALAHFHAAFRDEPLVLDKWFSLQARAPEPLGAAAAAPSRASRR